MPRWPLFPLLPLLATAGISLSSSAALATPHAHLLVARAMHLSAAAWKTQAQLHDALALNAVGDTTAALALMRTVMQAVPSQHRAGAKALYDLQQDLAFADDDISRSQLTEKLRAAAAHFERALMASER